jgi:hypothetical protein
MVTKTFILNDETVTNSYGFSIANGGIDLAQFEANPVMLKDHWNSTSNVIGRWEKIRIEGNQLLADAVFDVDDADAKEIAGKVDRGFIKAVSMGIGFMGNDMTYANETYILVKCVLKEASIVAIPSNGAALVLYDLTTGEKLNDAQLQAQLNGANPLQNLNPTKIMKQFMLSAAALVALSLNAQPQSDDELSGAIAQLSGKLEAEKAKFLKADEANKEALKKATDELVALKATQTKALLDQAIAEGKLVEAERAEYAELSAEMLVKTLAKIPAKVTLADQVKGGAATGNEPKTFDELMALSDDAKLAFKEANPSKYKELVG